MYTSWRAREWTAPWSGAGGLEFAGGSSAGLGTAAAGVDTGKVLAGGGVRGSVSTAPVAATTSMACSGVGSNTFWATAGGRESSASLWAGEWVSLRSGAGAFEVVEERISGLAIPVLRADVGGVLTAVPRRTWGCVKLNRLGQAAGGRRGSDARLEASTGADGLTVCAPFAVTDRGSADTGAGIGLVSDCTRAVSRSARSVDSVVGVGEAWAGNKSGRAVGWWSFGTAGDDGWTGGCCNGWEASTSGSAAWLCSFSGLGAGLVFEGWGCGDAALAGDTVNGWSSKPGCASGSTVRRFGENGPGIVGEFVAPGESLMVLSELVSRIGLP